ncbi:hypothetical protein LPTSP4_30330 [Leptospira ryugenii]|uniref:EcsC family protein n=1 Tax=Leptospira ryugenii TaxID=1917863 RepID=A0A2P2E3M6_9LEPT|nr:hypothetical protein [Leptospira ryugenii]GBF51495.1 hypothetical protein LPTSP4_30330 [Leptospira ryugenii]
MTKDAQNHLPRSQNSFLESLIDLFTGLEEYKSPYAPTIQAPNELIQELIQNASLKCALISGTCSLPPGPLGLLSILPELLMIYRIQGQLVIDIAALLGKEVQVTKELLLYCMFKNAGAQIFRKVIEESSMRILIRPTTVRFFQSFLEKIGIMISQRMFRKQFTRWIPIGGAFLTGTLTYYDTKSIGLQAKSLFSKEIETLSQTSELLTS